MNEFTHLADEIESAAMKLLGQQAASLTIAQWCQEYRRTLADIEHGRGVSLPSIALVGAKGQGKTWVARQLILDRRIAELLPSGVLSRESTTLMTWIGPTAPEPMDTQRDHYLPCPVHCMLDLGRPYMLLDMPGYTDDEPTAAAIAKEAMSLAPIKLIVARRDQLRSAIHSQLAALTEGSVCIPVITCVPLKELPVDASHPRQASPSWERSSESLRSDLEWYRAALSSSAPSSRILEPVLVADFEADGDEEGVGQQLAIDLRQRLAQESMESLAATRAHRIAASGDRLRHRVSQLIETQIPQLAASVRRLHTAADSMPTQAIETVLGSKQILKIAIRDRIRADLISGTSLLWFPYRTMLNLLGVTHGAWDRLLLSMTGSLPSLFGTLVAWARNFGQARDAHRDVQNGIRDQIQRQIHDRLQPAQQQFYREVERIRGAPVESRPERGELRVHLSGIDELQAQTSEVFDFTFEQWRTPRAVLQGLGLLGAALFWMLFGGPILAIYRDYLLATYHAWTDASARFSEFPHPTFGALATAGLLSALPVLLFAMVVMSWFQRHRRLQTIADAVYSAELRKVEELKSKGILQLHYEDPLLESAEFLVHLDRYATSVSPTSVL